MNNPAGAESATKVRGIVEEFLEAKQRESAPKPARMRPEVLRRWLYVILAFGCAVVWLAPLPVPEPATIVRTPERVQAEAKVLLVLAAGRVRDYEKRHGKLPQTLRQAGVDIPAMQYRLNPPGFELSTQANGAPLVYRSFVDPADFLGRARKVLESGT
jgi:hypothetical protein